MRTAKPPRRSARAARAPAVGDLLAALERARTEFGGGAAARKARLIRALGGRRFARAAELARFHEVLCFLRAYPDDEVVLGLVEELLAGFDRRPDLRRHRRALADSGIAGAEIRFRFYAHAASWLARRWGDRLRVEWRALGEAERLESVLSLLAHYAETPALDEYALSMKACVDRLKGPRETDAAFLVRRFDRLRVDAFLRETLYEGLALPLRLLPGPTTPARTRERLRGGAPVFQTRPLRRTVASLPAEIARPPLAVRAAGRRDAETLIDLARETMVARRRDLDAFTHAARDDVLVVECGDGLRIACVGVVPERRLLLESVHGYLVLKNGVPVAYGTSCALFGSSELAYNVFETFRGAEAAHILGRVLSMVRHLFGVDTFTMVPYQLGEENPEALRSGAWWFYQRLGFRPRERAILRLMREELRARRADPTRRSSIATLESLAKGNVYLRLGRARDDVLGVVPLAAVGLAVSESLARDFGADRERAARVRSREAAALLGVRSLGAFSPGERLAWERWAPLVAILPGVARWPSADKRALVAVVRAKGGPRESEFVRRFDRHRRLRRSVAALAARVVWSDPLL